MALQRTCLWFEAYMSLNGKIINVSCNLCAQRIMVKTTYKSDPFCPPSLALSSIVMVMIMIYRTWSMEMHRLSDFRRIKIIWKTHWSKFITISEQSSSMKIMHQSIPSVNIPPGQPPGLCTYLQPGSRDLYHLNCPGVGPFIYYQ